MPQFIPHGISMYTFGPILVLIHSTESLVWFVLLILATKPLARWLKRSDIIQALDRLTGSILIFFGAKLIFERRS
jgi:threonine/homoserine/homoserine lactone efflux protein